ncbi:MAG TPA: hypothetical protein VNA32_05285 [Actinomycetota bacterium]|nr:hypothetical protein [Actinomycetota bacterium]
MAESFWQAETYKIGLTDCGAELDVGGFSFNNPSVFDGYTVERLLVGWRAQTDLVDNSSGVQANPMPWFIGISYVPNPSFAGEPSSETPEEMIFGDALYSAITLWEPSRWTDGTIHASQWVAHSQGMESVQGRRTIQDKTTARLVIGAQCMSDIFGGVGSNFTDFGFGLALYVKILIKRTG